jgi:hypothetical protein
MDDDEKAELARQGLRAAELVQPGKLTEKVKESVADAAGNAALRGLAAVARFTGQERSPARSRAVAAVDLDHTLDVVDADDEAVFERRLKDAAARKERDLSEQRELREQRENEQAAQEARRLDLAELRRSFPEQSRELALLVFNCVDLLEDLSEDAEGSPPADPAELERKEKLLTRIAALLAPRAGDALESFVAHVVQTSQQYRGE